MDDLIKWGVDFSKPYNDFDISVDPNSAREMVSARIPPWVQERMNNLGRLSLREVGIECEAPYQFYRDTSLVERFNIGSDGTSLELVNRDCLTNFEEPIRYVSQGEVSLIKKGLLLSLFRFWVSCGLSLKGWSIIYNNQ